MSSMRRNPTVRSLVANSRNPACKRRVGVEVVAQFHLPLVAEACGASATLSPSRIATDRGNRFEEGALGGVNGKPSPLPELIADEVWGDLPDEIVDLRDGTALSDMPGRAEKTRRWLEALTDPCVARAPVVALELSQGRTAYLELDCVAWDGQVLWVVELKSFAAIDGVVAADQAAAAAAQAAFYRHALGRLGVRVASTALLVTPTGFRMRPSIHSLGIGAHEPFVRSRLEQLAATMADVEEAASQLEVETVVFEDPARPVGEQQAANRAALQRFEPHLVPGCLGSCPLWEVCRDEVRAETSGAQIASYGTGHIATLAGVASLQRAAALAEGEDAQPGEEETAVTLQQTAALLDAIASVEAKRGAA